MNSVKADLERRVKELNDEQEWNHAIALPHGVWTANPAQRLFGKNQVKWERIEPLLRPLNLSGRRVLDIGCNEGFFTVQVSRLGAREVVGCEISELRLRKARFVAETLQLTNVRFNQISVFDPRFSDLGRFDLALCLGFIHRVPDPFGVLQLLSKMADIIVLEWKSIPFGSARWPLIAYDGRLSLPDDPYSRAYFRPSVASVRAILSDLGLPHHVVAEENRQQRALVIASAAPLPQLASSRSAMGRRVHLLAKYTRWYLGHVRDVLQGRPVD